MPKRLSKRRRKTEDAAESGFRTLQRIIERTEDTPAPRKQNVVAITEHRRKNPAAVALGRKGGRNPSPHAWRKSPQRSAAASPAPPRALGEAETVAKGALAHQ